MAVYFVQCEETKLVKIGHSKHFNSRLSGLRTSSPGELTVLRVTEGGKDLERKLHETFATNRVRGEWFRPSSELLAEIERLPRTVIVDDGDHVRIRRRVPGKIRPHTAELDGDHEQYSRWIRPHDVGYLAPWLPPTRPQRRPEDPSEVWPQSKRDLPYLDQPQINRSIVEAIIKSNASFTKIAKTHGMSKQRVHQIAARLKKDGIAFPPRTIGGSRDPQAKKLEVMAGVADTSDRYEVIAFQCGVTVAYVQHIAQWLREQGVDVPSRALQRKRGPKRQLIEMDIIETTMSFEKLGEKYGYTNSSRIGQIAKDLRERGITFTERRRGGHPVGIHGRGAKGLKRQAIEKDIIETSMTFVEIAGKHGLSDGYVGHVAKGLRERGIAFVKRLCSGRSTPQPCDHTTYPCVQKLSDAAREAYQVKHVQGQLFNWMREVS